MPGALSFSRRRQPPKRRRDRSRTRALYRDLRRTRRPAYSRSDPQHLTLPRLRRFRIGRQARQRPEWARTAGGLGSCQPLPPFTTAASCLGDRVDSVELPSGTTATHFRGNLALLIHLLREALAVFAGRLVSGLVPLGDDPAEGAEAMMF